MKGMGESLYQSMDAPMAPLEKKVEAWKPAEKCCGALDLCAASSLPHPAPPRRSRVQPPPRALDGARWPDDLSPRLTPRPGVCRPAQQNRHDAHHGGERASVVCAVGLLFRPAPCSLLLPAPSCWMLTAPSARRSLVAAFTLTPTCACSITSHGALSPPLSTTTSSRGAPATAANATPACGPTANVRRRHLARCAESTS